MKLVEEKNKEVYILRFFGNFGWNIGNIVNIFEIINDIFYTNPLRIWGIYWSKYQYLLLSQKITIEYGGLSCYDF